MTKYFSFEGTAKRSEYWAMILVCVVVSVVIGMLMEASVAFGVLLLGVLWYQLATIVRRIRDTGNNVWWVLVFLLPVVSAIAAIVFGVLKSVETDEA